MIGLLAGGVGLAAVAGALLSGRGYLKEPDGAGGHGNAKGEASIAQNWAELKEAGRKAGLTWGRSGGLFLSAVEVEPERLRLIRLQGELGGIFISPPGGGKTTGFVMNTIADGIRAARAGRPQSYLLGDPAAQLLLAWGRPLQEAGFRVEYFNVEGVEDAAVRAKFGTPARRNPLGAIDLNAPNAEAKIAAQAGIICPVSGQERSPFFPRGGQWLGGNVGYFFREVYGAKATWCMVAEFLRSSEHNQNAVYDAMRLSRSARVRACGSEWYRQPDRFGALPPYSEGRRDQLATACNEFAFLLSAPVMETFGGDGDGDFASMKREPCATFLIASDTPGDDLQKCNQLLLSMGKEELTRIGGDLTVDVILDDVGATTRKGGDAATMIGAWAAVARKFKVRISTIFQDWNQFVLWCGSKEAALSLRAQMAALAFLGANDPESIAVVMREGGEYTIFSPSNDPMRNAGMDGGVGVDGKPLFSPEDIRGCLESGHMIVFLIGSRKTVVLPIVPYFQIPEFAALADDDPYHGKEGA